jgi:hypothetical protein
MMEEATIHADFLPTDNELLQIIESQCTLLATISDISDSEFRTYDDELVEMNIVKSYAYKVILASQKKLLKLIKDYEQRNTDNQKV